MFNIPHRNDVSSTYSLQGCIKELLTQGVTTINDDDATIEKAMDILHKRLEQSRAEAQRLQMQNDIQDQQLRIQAPKVEYHDKVLASQSTYNTTQIAKEFGWVRLR